MRTAFFGRDRSRCNRMLCIGLRTSVGLSARVHNDIFSSTLLIPRHYFNRAVANRSYAYHNDRREQVPGTSITASRMRHEAQP